MSDAADGYLGDWLPHKESCRCADCLLDKALAREKKYKSLYEQERQHADRMARVIKIANGHAPCDLYAEALAAHEERRKGER